MAKKSEVEETGVAENPAGEPVTDSNIYALLESAKIYLEHKQAEATSQMPRKYGQVLTMLGATMANYKHNILDADVEALSQPQQHSG